METPKAVTAITGDTKVTSMLGDFPQSLGVLLDHGLARLRDPQERQKLESGLSVQDLARAEGLDLPALLAELNRVFGIVRGGGASAPQDSGDAVRGDMIVGELLERKPELLGVFVKHGFAALQDERLRTTMAKTVTIAMAAQIHGVPLQELVGDLNKALTDRATT